MRDVAVHLDLGREPALLDAAVDSAARHARAGHPNVRKFVDWVAKKDPDFTATTTKKQR
jgi:hypothetical protein